MQTIFMLVTNQMKNAQEENDEQSIINKVELLHELYYERYAFPKWVISSLKDGLMEYEKYANTVTTYYNSFDNNETTLQNVLMLTEQREPVNISMGRLYDEDILKKCFGYKTGCYGKLKDSVNISMYMKTPFLNENDNFIYDVNVLNVIAPAFDSKYQPDVKFFHNNPEKIINRYALIFNMIFYCALHQGMKKIYITGFGLGAFMNNKQHYEQGFRKSYAKYKQILNRKKIQMYYWSYDTSEINIHELKPVTVDYNNLGKYICEILKSDVKAKDSILFINAWDPFSIVGNGNESDGSWDGHFGRRTSMAVLSLPQINKHIKYVDICQP